MISHVFEQCLHGVTKIDVRSAGTCFNVGWFTFPDVEWFYLDEGRVTDLNIGMFSLEITEYLILCSILHLILM